MPPSIEKLQQVVNPIELWKAIHGGCWPGPPPDVTFTNAVQEVVAALALHNLSHSFTDEGVGRKLRGVAAESLNAAIPALQKAVRT
ncbi:MAG TPA: hypothetical protein VFC23_10430 [Thermoanaerobaculia bacterium]|nr:hypothetical protein [Thermoanaerobaculia bacterium]